MKNYILLALISIFTFSSCTKDDPTQELDQEQLNSATLIFTPVVKETKDGKATYTPMQGEEAHSIKFEAPTYLPPVGTHLHLHVGHTYKLELKTTDFAGRASEQTFLNRPENHQAFLLGAENTELDFVYADETNVGITAYITVKQEASVVLNYVMRHLRPNVKKNITAEDWNNTEYTKFTGDNDLDLKFEVHFVDEDHGH
ncbi:hypothetical protein [Sphingobacterium bovistauri]|uniref:Lipoprotein n=1 Tax=Sphingobacterium bovistauri TaxID=2781959 RepID=A0ABS7Z3M6_9SPHI|nr:hypothetical protein [Sphingobacterium bovistauri]MCA5004759.1 hypothetical protein [Sphingobacterium bovistauri]